MRLPSWAWTDEESAARRHAEMLAALRAQPASSRCVQCVARGPPGLWQLYAAIGRGSEALRKAALELRSYDWG